MPRLREDVRVAASHSKPQTLAVKKYCTDAVYCEDQIHMKREWRERNRGYPRQYRAEHPKSIALNRMKQRICNAARKAVPIAKMDVSPVALPVSGRYLLTLGSVNK